MLLVSVFRGIKSELLIEGGGGTCLASCKSLHYFVFRLLFELCMHAFLALILESLDSVTRVWCPETVATSETEVYPVFVDVCVYEFV